MMAIVRTVAGILLLAHGLVHLLYLASDVQEFSFDRSWVVPESLRRQVGLGLMVATVVAFALVALAVWGVPRMSADWPALTLLAALLSVVLLAAFWNTWLLFGLTIDVLLVIVAVTQPHWADQLTRAGS
jgi:hypothetical protein